MQARHPDRLHDVRPSNRTVEVAAPQWSIRWSSEDQSAQAGPTKADRRSRRSAMIARGTPTTRRAAFDSGGLRVTADPGARRSENAARTRMYPAVRSNIAATQLRYLTPATQRGASRAQRRRCLAALAVTALRRMAWVHGRLAIQIRYPMFMVLRARIMRWLGGRCSLALLGGLGKP
jgi:hypothetical protein